MKNAVIFSNRPDKVEQVYGSGRRERIAQLCRLYPHVITEQNFDQHAHSLRETEVIFSTWGMFPLTDEHLDRMPQLQALFYAAGTVKKFADPLLRRNVKVVSAWGANAKPVSEFTLAQILLATKGYFRNAQACKSYETRSGSEPFRGRGNYGETVAVLGAGMVGRSVIALLNHFHLRVIVYDPYLSDEAALQLNAAKVSLEEAFARALVVSNHVPRLPETHHLITAKHFASMRQDATFINTARGDTIAEDELAEVFKARSDLTALIDVTQVEPPQPESELYQLPNVHLTSHIAGALGDEVLLLADCCIDEFAAWQSGQPMRYEIRLDMLPSLA